MAKEYEASRAARILGAKGGKKGGPARAKVLTQSQRTAIARMGGKARRAQQKAK